MFKHFLRGIGCYTCASCGKRTRATSLETEGIYPRICQECYELACIDNEETDGVITTAEAKERRAEVTKKRKSAAKKARKRG